MKHPRFALKVHEYRETCFLEWRYCHAALRYKQSPDKCWQYRQSQVRDLRQAFCLPSEGRILGSRSYMHYKTRNLEHRARLDAQRDLAPPRTMVSTAWFLAIAAYTGVRNGTRPQRYAVRVLRALLEDTSCLRRRVYMFVYMRLYVYVYTPMFVHTYQCLPMHLRKWVASWRLLFWSSLLAWWRSRCTRTHPVLWTSLQFYRGLGAYRYHRPGPTIYDTEHIEHEMNFDLVLPDPGPQDQSRIVAHLARR